MSGAVNKARRIALAHRLVRSACLLSSRSTARRHGALSGLVMQVGTELFEGEAAAASDALGVPERWVNVWERAYQSAAHKRIARMVGG